MDKPTLLSPEQLLAMLLVDLRAIAEREQGGPVTDAVIAVPTYFTEPERHAVLAAAHVAGINCMRLLNETTANALAWGIYKTDLPEGGEPLRVVFVDIGFSATQVSLPAAVPWHVHAVRALLYCVALRWRRHWFGAAAAGAGCRSRPPCFPPCPPTCCACVRSTGVRG